MYCVKLCFVTLIYISKFRYNNTLIIVELTKTIMLTSDIFKECDTNMILNFKKTL